ncbi:MAG: transcription antitermination protein NusB [Muribaculaceae bacterium]|nr:transcription antitermination protein NusB [Muribaculaceae bacterium]
MINRILIRVKVLQNLYSYVLTRPERTFSQALKELDKSFEKSYELYFYILKLIVELTDLQERRLDDAKHKFLPTEEDLHPNPRFIYNRLAQALREDETFNKFCRDHNVSWQDDAIFLRMMLEKVLQSDIYKEYMNGDMGTIEDDCEVWRKLLKNVILEDADFEEKIESMSVHWSVEDIDIMGQFAIKTTRRFQENYEGEKYGSPILPMFHNDDDQEFGELLFRYSVEQMDENNELIDKFVRSDKWDAERIALMDRLIMCMAISEFKSFVQIPANVTMNEYIELAKVFSSPNSSAFVNGILNAAIKSLHR